MSSNLVWEPVNRETGDLEDGVKFAMRKKYGDPVDTQLDTSDIPYFEGLRDAGVKGAEAVIEAIQKHYDIVVKEVF